MAWGSVMLWLGGLVVGYILVHLLAEPARYAALAAGRAGLGYLALWVLNGLGLLAGFHLPLNPVTALVAGVLGVPGVLAVYLLSRIYG